MKRLLLVALASTMCTGTITGSLQAQQKRSSYVSSRHSFPSGSGTTINTVMLNLASWGKDCNLTPLFSLQLCSVGGSISCTTITHSNTYNTQYLYPNLYISTSSVELRFTNENFDYCGINVRFTLYTNFEEVQSTSTTKALAATSGNELDIQWKPGNTFYDEWTAPYCSADTEYVTSVSLKLSSWGTGCNVSPNWNVELCSGSSCSLTFFFVPNSYGSVVVHPYLSMTHLGGGSVRVRITNENSYQNCGLVAKGFYMSSTCEPITPYPAPNPRTPYPPAYPPYSPDSSRSTGPDSFVYVCVSIGAVVLFVVVVGASYLFLRGPTEAVPVQPQVVSQPMQEMGTPLLTNPQAV
eukprot:TRINITY_DN249_c0_g1_i1.p1 TRINITY_DN249_c0_g1~~TRINITY_DN249_c0_g1_i1.p1  ORF type:complete len:352 (+),score=18.22 TRINITY_DN249_c0_g1_i1:755-1810(+)